MSIVVSKFSIFGIGLYCWSVYASAHVKWFADYDLYCPPRSPSQIVFGVYFLEFCLCVGVLMFAVTCIDRYFVYRHGRLFYKMQALTEYSRPYIPSALRLGVSAFFISAASYAAASGEGFILTPDLKTASQWVITIHLVIALLVLLPRTAFLAGLGIVVLYIHAVHIYGVYHLLDYPIFIGVAACLIAESLFGQKYSITGQNIMRLCTGVTLLWASIEKFAYPEWSFGLLHRRPDLTFGFNVEFYMVAAGFVEFCAAWLLITGMLSAQIAAPVLLFFFVSAIYYFGVLDAIGHSAIIVVLALLTLSHNPLAAHFDTHKLTTTAFIHTGLFFAIMFLLIGVYCGGHYLSYSPYLHCIS